MGRPPVNGSSKEKGIVMGLKRGPWSTEEDEKLIAYIRRYGIWYWAHMAKPAGLARSGKSCRLRWMNYLRPNLKHGNFTKQEEDTIIRLQQLIGNRWSAIAAELPGRTDNEIKNYWNTRLKKRDESKRGRTNDTVSSTPQSSSSSDKIDPPNNIIYESLSPMSGSNTISSEGGSSVSYEGSSAMKKSLLQDTAGSLQSFWDDLHLPMLVDISSLD